MLQWPPILAKVQPHQRVQVTKRDSGTFVNTAVQLVMVAASLGAPYFGYVDHPCLQALCYSSSKRTPLPKGHFGSAIKCPLQGGSTVNTIYLLGLLLYLVFLMYIINYKRMPGHRKRRQFKQTDAFTRGMVIGLKRAGWSIRQIAADTHLGASTVHRLWRRWLKQGNVAIYRNVGATRVTSARVDRRILRQAVASPQATCTAILQHVQDTLDHSISTRTISRQLVANGLHSCRPLRRLPLTPPNRRQRLEWCRARSTWMTEWHRVVFSDESCFCLSSDNRRVRVWRRRGERSNPAAIVERPTMRQRGIMGVPNALYQQDNARPHTARISQQALQDVQMLPWPPYSPDLSPIEHVWDIIGRRLHALPQPRSEDELWQMVEREWRAIPQDAIRTLIDSLPRRVAACIAVRGGPTCY
ncbi:Transposase [Cordylochernes scorpioides]|uniref:Transposase n=1 Tax=Cordylochernes scorpioides TaxID=51811 RepID=A0ABY6KU57_9ARAC|nr:Transposase [Cordylochernes scorpioides]